MKGFNRVLMVALAAVLAGCGGQRQEQVIVTVDGSSTVYPVTEAVAEEFQADKAGSVQVTVGVSGTGGGFKKFCRGEIDISNASRPILAQEIDACRASGIEFIELPVAFDALTVVVHPENTWAQEMTVAELKTIWAPEAQGTITRWNQVNPAWPDEPLKLFGAGADSGTFDYFTEAVVGKSKSSRGDFTASEDDNVLVTGVSQDKNALGFFGYAYYEENAERLHAVKIKADADAPGVGPSAETVLDGSYQPLSRPIFIYVNAKSAKERPHVAQFVEYYLTHAVPLIKEVKYIPLPDSAYVTALANFKANKTGTVFAGHAEIGVRIDDLLKREAR